MDLPTGVVTFLFTDIQGSTQLWEHQPALMQAAVRRHDELLRECIEAQRGYVFKTVGDAFCAAFMDPAGGVAAAISAQQALATEPWHGDCVIRARMALHVGEAEEREGDYFGPTVNRVARLLSAGHGGQTLASRALWAVIQDQLGQMEVEVEDMGEHRLKDLVEPEHIFHLRIAGLAQEFPPLKVLDYQPTNLPVQATAFVGRMEELAALEELIRRPEVRLVTLVGPGGTGKTRLAFQAGAELLDSFSDGVYVANLAPLDDPALVLSTIADALHVQESGGRSLQDVLIEYLRDKQMLLLLDNFEHLLPAAPAVSTLLAACPTLTVLVTSRASLRLSGEHEYPVSPLAVPPRAGLMSLDELAGVDSVALFVERARAIKSDFVLSPANAVSVTDICRRLEGLPLAIELAAARIRLFPPPVLLNRLSSRLKLLTGGARDLPARQQTLRGTIDWSYSLLDPAEQRVFAALSVFAGGCTFEAAEAVCATDPELELDILDGITSLVEKSLLRQTGEDEPRFSMLETIREYAGERLEESSQAALLRRAHTEYFATLAKDAEPAFTSADQDSWLDRLEAEQDNFRAAIDWCLAGGNDDIALQLCASLYWFWYVRGHLSEGRRLLDEALTRDVAPQEPVRARAWIGAGSLALGQGDLARAETALQNGLALARELGDRPNVALALNTLGVLAYIQGGYEQARTLNEESLALYRELNDSWGIASTLNELAMLATGEGDFERAGAMYEEALALARRSGQRRAVAILLFELGLIRCQEGEYARAESLFQESAAALRQVGDKLLLAHALEEIAVVAQILGEPERVPDALAESLALLREADDKLALAEWLEIRARIASLRGEAERAARFHGAAASLREQIGAPQAPDEEKLCERDLAAARAQLGEQWQDAWQAGKSLSVEQALAAAL
jgi:predicted ATPase/class 3 adenylate cyclase